MELFVRLAYLRFTVVRILQLLIINRLQQLMMVAVPIVGIVYVRQVIVKIAILALKIVQVVMNVN